MIMDNETPSIISFGKRCMEDGYSSQWAPYSDPVFISPDGKRTTLQVRNYVPISASAIGGFEGPRSETTGLVGELQAPLDFECPVADGGESDKEVAEIIKEDDDLPIPDAVEAFDLGNLSASEANVRPRADQGHLVV